MKRVLVILLAIFLTAGTIGAAFAESIYSPFEGLIFNDPDLSIASGVTMPHSAKEPPFPLTGGYYYTQVGWGLGELPYNNDTGYIIISCFNFPITPNTSGSYPAGYSFDVLYEHFDVGMQLGPVTNIDKGKSTVAGLPAFYTIQEVDAFGEVMRNTQWYISCEDRYFMVQLSIMDYKNPSLQFHNAQLEIIFNDFLNNLKATTDLKPGYIGSSNSNSGGCDALGGLFGLLSLLSLSAITYRSRKSGK